MTPAGRGCSGTCARRRGPGSRADAAPGSPPSQANTPRSSPHEPGDRVEEGALARAVRPDHRDDAARRHVEVHVAKGGQPPNRTVRPRTCNAFASPRRRRPRRRAPPTSACCASAESARLPPGRRDQALAAEQHHAHEHEPEDQLGALNEIDALQRIASQHPPQRVQPLRQVGQEPALQQREQDGAEHHAPHAAHAAEHHHDQDHHRDREAEHLRRRGLQLGHVEHAHHPGERRANGEGEQLVARGIDAHRARRDLVLADRRPGPSDAAVPQAQRRPASAPPSSPAPCSSTASHPRRSGSRGAAVARRRSARRRRS